MSEGSPIVLMSVLRRHDLPRYRKLYTSLVESLKNKNTVVIDYDGVSNLILKKFFLRVYLKLYKKFGIGYTDKHIIGINMTSSMKRELMFGAKAMGIDLTLEEGDNNEGDTQERHI